VTTLKWYNEHGFLMGEQVMPKLISESAILKTARRKSREKSGFSSLREGNKLSWFLRGKKVRFKKK
jgi:hypothetical protein